jgi:hypothetical protein
MEKLTRDIKIWETGPVGMASFRDKLMAFCYEHKCAPDDVAISPYADLSPCGVITEMGIRLIAPNNSN